MILTRSTRLSQPADAAGVDSRFGGRNDWLIAPGSPGSLPISGVVPTIPDQYGSSHYFDGASLQVLGNDANVNATGGQFTLLAYAKFDNTTSDHGVVGNRATTGANAYAQIVHRAPGASRQIVFTYKGASASVEVGILSAAQSIPVGSTQLVAMVVNGTSVRCYIGAELVGSGVSTAPVPSGHLPYLRAGNYYDNSITRRFRGGIYYAGLLPVALSGEDIAALSRNPWQLFRPVQRRIYFDVGAGGTAGVTVEGTNSVQLSTSDSGYIGQEHLLVSSSSAQLGTLTAMGIAQANTLSGNPLVQTITSVGGAVTQISILSGEATASSSGTSQGVIQQVNKLLGADCLVLSSSSSAGLLQANNLVAISSAQLSLTTAAGILQSHVLLGGATFQSSYATSGGMSLTPLIELSAGVVQSQSLSGAGQVSQDHKLSHGQSEQPATSSNGATVQTHVLVSSNAVQFVLSSSEAIAVEERGLLQGSSVSQGNTITLGVILQGNILRGTSARQLTLSSSGAITQTGVLPPLTDAELREILAGMQLAIARLQVRLDAMY